MTSLSRATALALCVLLVATSATSGTPKGSVTISDELRQQLSYFDLSSAQPVDVIVKLSGEPAALLPSGQRATRLNQIRTERGNVFSHLRRNGISVSPKHEFELVFVGFALSLPANQLPVLASIPGVIGIHENVPIARESNPDDVVLNARPELAESVGKVHASAAWNLGYRGEGIVVGILDDGVDWSHPDLGGCLGAGCKVIAGYDFIDLDSNPNSEWSPPAATAPAGSPWTRDYHGTHVAATAAGLKGVAPEAKIVAARVLGTNSSGKVSNLGNVMAGIEFAIRENVNVINMSIGLTNAYGQSTNLWTEMATNAVRAGIVWVNSNGNDGPSTYRANMYGSGSEVIATGNSDAREINYPRTTLAGSGEVLLGGSYGIEFPAALLNTPLQIVDVGFGNTPAYYAGKDVAGKVVLASRGGVTGEDAAFVNKGNQAHAAGAAAIIISNNVAGDFFSTALATLPIPNFTLSQANGVKLRANLTATISNLLPGAQMNSGSSRGPTADLMIKPDLSAPGTSITAAAPFETSSTGYVTISGTSMAAPHVAGAAALLRQANPSWTPAQVKAALMNTATNLADLFGQPYRPIDQGAGLINISRAIAPGVRIQQPSLSYGQLLGVNGFSATKTVTVEANGTYNVTSFFTSSPAGGMVTTSANTVFGGPSTFGVTVSVDPNAPAGEYQGYVQLTNVADPAERYGVPFLFVHKVPVSEVKFSKTIARSSSNPLLADQITVTFKAGAQLAEWWLGNSTGSFRFTANQPATEPGPVSYDWNVRQSNGNAITGSFTFAVWYRLPGQSGFTASQIYRIFIDNEAPSIGLEELLPSLTNSREVTVRGAVADVGMFTWGEIGGKVLVNGEPADLFPRAPTVVFTGAGWNSELAFDKTITLAEGQNTVTIYAEDAAGNRSTQTYSLTTTLDTIAPVTTAATNPVPNAAGWNRTAAFLTIVSADGGSGVKEVQYSVNGTAPVVVAGSTAALSFGEGQHAVSFFGRDVAGNEESVKSANVWIDITAPAFSFSGNGAYTVDQQVIVGCSATDNLSGIASTNCSAPLLSKFGWELPLGTTSLTATATDVADNSATATATVQVSVTHESLANVTRTFVPNTGVASSLAAKLQAAKDAFARGNLVAMNNQLQAFQNEVAAQSGSGIPADHAAVLVKLAQALKQ